VKLAHLLCAVLLSSALAGCQLLPSPPAELPLPAQQRQTQLAQLQQFTIQSSLGVTSPDQSVKGSLQWQQQGEFYQAQMNTFIGINVFSIKTDATGAQVQVDGQLHQADSATVLLDYLSGWSLPIAEMPLWLKGMASPSSQDLHFDSLGRLTSFTMVDSQHQTWQVQYLAFFPDRLALPKKITLSSNRVELKLVIRSWSY